MNIRDPNLTQDHVRAMLRNDFSFFARGAFKTLLSSTTILWNWHLDLIANKLEDTLTGKIRNLIINIPPRYGKSLIASTAFPAFILGHDPTAEIVCMSYGQDLAEHTALNTRRLMTSPMYETAFDTRLVNRRAKLSELRTTEGGMRMATSVEGTLTGRGGNFLIIDDPLKPSEAQSATQREAVNLWYNSTTVSRSNDKENGVKIVIMQRLHEDDLVGHLLRQGHWELLSLPAIAETDELHEIRTLAGTKFVSRREGEALHPERESLARIEEVREVMGPYTFAAQYQQRPSPAGGGIVKLEWFHRFDLAHPPAFDRIVQSWDTASKPTELADYSVVTTWGVKGRNAYLIHVYRERLDYPALKAAVARLAAQHEANEVLVEDAASGIQLCQELGGQVRGLRAIKPHGTNKVMRMHAQTGLIEAGRVFLPYNAPWLAAYENELAMFDRGQFDDQVDSTTQALAELFCGPYAGFWEMIRADMEPKPEPPMIRVNHPDPRRFILITGRTAERQSDGSFLVTEEEYRPLRQIEGLYRVD
ncbi:phage terminase large subunit [Sphingomonas sp. ASV193]|uniref:phage terminase large subunit n=1 Tax=Sphingomonas sp. ASV193 TaxID=3144405 RepID=UPI0032E8D892